MEDQPDSEAPIYGKVLRKQRRKRQKLLVIELLLDYAKNSTLHGLRYIAERGLSCIEKTFWLITFLLSVGMCFYLISLVYYKWKTSPVIVSFSEDVVSVGKVPFPSITICPQIKSMQATYNFTEEYSKYLEMKANGTINLEEMPSMKKLQDVTAVCDSGDLNLDSILDRKTTDASMIKNIIDVAPKVSDVFYYCSWRDQPYPCEKVFKSVLTNEGVCYNINALAAKEIFRYQNIQKDYPYLKTAKPRRNFDVTKGYTNYDTDPYPRRGRENSASPDMQIILQESRNHFDGLCNSLNSGFKIYVQNPADLPQDSLYYYAALPKQVSSIALKFNMLTTSETLQSYSAEVRQCYFPADRPLKYFRVYTPNNCRLECLADFVYFRCGCVWYNMPHITSKNICTVNMKECVKKAQDELATMELKAELGAKKGICNCLPSCYSIHYDAEILKTQYDLKKYIHTLGKIENTTDYSDLDEFQFSKIEMYFKEPRFMSMRRSELFGLTDFLANCGGLLGLFLGFSFLSLVEIGYFLTLRLCCTLKRDLREEKRASMKSRSEQD